MRAWNSGDKLNPRGSSRLGDKHPVPLKVRLRYAGHGPTLREVARMAWMDDGWGSHGDTWWSSHATSVACDGSRALIRCTNFPEGLP